MCIRDSISTETPYKDLPENFRKVLLNGSGEDEIEFKFWRGGKVSSITRPFEGILPNLERLATDSESEFIRNRLKAYMTPQFCDACGGKRLKPEILAVTLGGESYVSQLKTKKTKLKLPGLSIMDVCGLSVEKADEFFAALKLTEFEQKIAAEVIKEIRARLGFLRNVGLGYQMCIRDRVGIVQRHDCADQFHRRLHGHPARRGELHEHHLSVFVAECV